MERLGREIKAELGRFGPAAGMAELVEVWPEAVGAAIATNAWPARLTQDGTLVVHAKDSVWAFELTQQRSEIAARLGALAPRTLRFVAGPIPEAPAEADLHAPVEVPQPGPEESALAAELASTIADEELRARVAKAASLSLARAAADRRF